MTAPDAEGRLRIGEYSKQSDSDLDPVCACKRPDKEGAAMNPKVRLATEFLNKSLHRNLTLDDICGVVELKRSRLCELFQNEFKMTPLRYHKELRLKRACERLENSLDKVEAIIIELGYDRSRFFRDFKVYFDLTPSQYRVHHIDAQSSIKNVEDK